MAMRWPARLIPIVRYEFGYDRASDGSRLWMGNLVMTSIAIIPARGGSKRIPKKNILDFFGKPMIAWSIEAALESKLFDKVLVSTDDPEIAKLARAYGAQVPFLRETAADEYAPVSEATLISLLQAEAYWKTSFDTVVQLMANCPIRSAKDIEVAYNDYCNHQASFQISAFEFGWMNPWWAASLEKSAEPKSIFPSALNSRSQDLDKLYCPTGAIWIANTKALKQVGTFYGPGHRFSIMPWTAAVDIDDYDDLKMAKAVYLMAQAGE